MCFSFDFGWYSVILILSVKNRGVGFFLLDGQNLLSVTKVICRQSLIFSNVCLKMVRNYVKKPKNQYNDKEIQHGLHLLRDLGVCMAIFFFKWRSQQMVQVGLSTLQNPY